LSDFLLIDFLPFLVESLMRSKRHWFHLLLHISVQRGLSSVTFMHAA